MEYVSSVEEKEDGYHVKFYCPLCKAQAEDFIPKQISGRMPRHSCEKEQISYPLLPIVSITEVPLRELSIEEKLEQQLISVNESFDLMKDFQTTSQEVLFSLPAAFFGAASVPLGVINIIILTGVFSGELQSNMFLLGAFVASFVALIIGTLSIVFGTYSTLITTYNVYVSAGGELSFLSFIAAVGNYYESDPFTLGPLTLFFFYPSWSFL